MTSRVQKSTVGKRPRITVPINPEAESFAFLCASKKPLLSRPEAARALGRKEDYVTNKIQDGRLESHSDPRREKDRPVITRRSVLSLLADTADYDPAKYDAWLALFVRTLTPEQLAKLAEAAKAILDLPPFQ